jgi:hypothetical protein
MDCPGGQWVEDPKDCDDQDADVVIPTWYFDGDGDGHGVEAETAVSCVPPEGFVAASGDCDDADGLINPEAVEVCHDDVDNNCQGEETWCLYPLRPTRRPQHSIPGWCS